MLQGYKAIICLPLVKQDNVQDFKEFLYKEYIPMFNKLQIGQCEKEILDKVNYENKCKQVKNYEQLINSFNDVKDGKVYFYGIEILPNKEDEEENETEPSIAVITPFKKQRLELEDRLE